MFTCCSTMVAPAAAKPDHERDHPQVAATAPASAAPRRPPTPALLLDAARAADLVPPDDQRRRCRRSRQRRGADQQQVVAADLVDDERGEAGADRAAQAGAAADEAEHTLGLARVVDVVGQRPELADEQDAEDLAEQVERRRNRIPSRSGAAPRTRPAARRCRPASPASRRGAAACESHALYWCISTPISSPAASMTHGRLSAPKLGDELGSRDRLEDVVARSSPGRSRRTSALRSGFRLPAGRPTGRAPAARNRP